MPVCAGQITSTGLSVDDYIANPRILREPHKFHKLNTNIDAQFEADVERIISEHRWLLNELAKRWQILCQTYCVQV